MTTVCGLLFAVIPVSSPVVLFFLNKRKTEVFSFKGNENCGFVFMRRANWSENTELE